MNSFKTTFFLTIRTVLSVPCKVFLLVRGIKNRIKLLRECRPERIIVSMTSWSKRIDNVAAVIESILNNSMTPDLIVLNLSLEEFPRKEKDLPKELVAYQQNGILEILWQEGNTRAFKKIIPTLNKYPDDVIIAIDDDFIYPKDFIESFVNKHKEFPLHPISGNDVILYGEQAHCGCASLVKRAHFGKYLDELLDDTVIQIGMDDVFYTFCVVLNGYHYRNVGKLFFKNMPPNNPVEGLSTYSQFDNDDIRFYLADKVKKMYHIHMTYLSKPFFVI